MNKTTFSIFSTLSEALRLGARHAKLICSIAVVVAIPSMLWEAASPFLIQSHALWTGFLALPVALVLFIVTAMKTAAILGVLKSAKSEATFGPVIMLSIQTYTWTLVRLSLLLMLIAWVFIVPISMAVAFSGKALVSPHNYVLQMLLVFFAILYLVFIKFALADPLIVIEGMGAIDSLKKSWEMTKGRFGYVLGCYVFLGAIEYFLTSAFAHFSTFGSFCVLNVITDLVSSLVQCLWILMAWCMYWRIKEAEGFKAP